MKQQIKLTWDTVVNSRHNLLKQMSLKRFGHNATSSKGKNPVPMLSGASKCVWQMDREA